LEKNNVYKKVKSGLPALFSFVLFHRLARSSSVILPLYSLPTFPPQTLIVLPIIFMIFGFEFDFWFVILICDFFLFFPYFFF